MVRFHGRNARMWCGKRLQSSRDRFDYLCTQEELLPWAKRIQRIAERLVDGQAHVIANNHAANHGTVAALDLQELLGQPVGLGQELPQAVVEIRRIASGCSGQGAH